MKSLAAICFSALICLSLSQDPNFYIFLAFGQSNMEGAGPIEDMDRQGVDERFQMMAAVDFPVEQRTKGQWYTGYPPLCRSYTRLCPGDYFGRFLSENLPKNIKIGIINVAVAGCSIDLFMEEKAEEYLRNAEQWLKDIAKQYNNNPFRYLVDRAKEAQRVGVIKGIIFHQGETNNGQQDWPMKVQTIYKRLITELGIAEVPFLAGETVTEEFNGCCSLHNNIIKTLPNYIRNAHVISAQGLQPQPDRTHFSSASYRTFGRRYGLEMLKNLNANEKLGDEQYRKELPAKLKAIEKELNDYHEEPPAYFLDIVEGKPYEKYLYTS